MPRVRISSDIRARLFLPLLWDNTRRFQGKKAVRTRWALRRMAQAERKDMEMCKMKDFEPFAVAVFIAVIAVSWVLEKLLED